MHSDSLTNLQSMQLYKLVYCLYLKVSLYVWSFKFFILFLFLHVSYIKGVTTYDKNNIDGTKMQNNFWCTIICWLFQYYNLFFYLILFTVCSSKYCISKSCCSSLLVEAIAKCKEKPANIAFEIVGRVINQEKKRLVYLFIYSFI